MPSPVPSTRSLALAAALLAACGGGGGGGTTPGGENPPPSWTIEVVDSAAANTGLFPSIAVDYLGTVHVSSLDVTNKKFRYARRTGAGWTRSDIASAGTSGFSTFGKYSAIAVDAAGVPHVSYHDADVEYVYVRGNATGTSWSKTSLPQAAIQYAFHGHNGIAVDRTTGQVHVVTWEYGNASPYESLAYWRPGDASKTRASGPAHLSGALHHGIDCSVALDPAGRPHFGFTAWNGLADPDAKNYAAWAEAVTSTSWTVHTVEQIDRGGYGNAYEERNSAFAMDGNGRPHLAYYHRGLNRMRYASWNGSAWTIETIGQPSVYASTSDLTHVAIAVDAANVPHVAYYGSANHVTYAKRTGANTWAREDVDTSTDTGNGVAIAVDAAGHVHIAYRAEPAFNSQLLKYARR